MKGLRLYLLRHAETEENVQGVLQGQQPGTLSARGRLQARAVAERLRQEPLDVIYSSDLARARETVKAVAGLHDIPVKFVPELRERALGILEGKPGLLYQQAFLASGAQRLEFRPEGGESILELKARTDHFLERLRRDCEGQNVLVCSHGGAVMTILANLLQAEMPEMLNYSFHNTSLTVADISQCGVRVLCFNSTEHLPALKEAALTNKVEA